MVHVAADLVDPDVVLGTCVDEGIDAGVCGVPHVRILNAADADESATVERAARQLAPLARLADERAVHGNGIVRRIDCSIGVHIHRRVLLRGAEPGEDSGILYQADVVEGSGVDRGINVSIRNVQYIGILETFQETGCKEIAVLEDGREVGRHRVIR